jgi:hypothetical protein
VVENAKVAACEEGVGFAQTFNTHILGGEASGQTHTGYHSENVNNFAAFGVGAVTQGPDAQGVYVATCTMQGQANVKDSTFFPNGWNIARIRTEVAHAFCHQINLGGIVGRGAVSWAGYDVAGTILIGGRGAKNSITTAFPGFGGAFV